MASESSDDIFITLPVAITSAIITIITSSIAIFVIQNFLFPETEKEQTHTPSPAPVQLRIDTEVVSNLPELEPTHGSKSVLVSVPSKSPPLSPSLSPASPQTHPPRNGHVSSINPTPKHPMAPTAQKTPRAKGIQIYVSCALTVFNALNTAFNTIYCVWVVFEPRDNNFYADHPSYTHRIISTVCWFIAKNLFVWMLCFRLYHSFKGSMFRVNAKFVFFLGIIITIFTPIALVVAYWGVLVVHNQMVAEAAFTSWRVLYQIIVFTILYMFCNRLLRLVIGHEMEMVIKARKSEIKREIQRQTSTRVSIEFLDVITKHAALVLTVSLTVLMTTLCWTGFRFVLGPPTRVTLLVPMNMAALDSLVTSICIVCLFPVGKSVYATICRPPHVCFKGVCLFFAKRRLTVF
eukprot:13090_1